MARTHEVCSGSATAGSPGADESPELPRVQLAQAARVATPNAKARNAKRGIGLILGAGLIAGGCHRAKPAADAAPPGALLKVEMGKATKLDPDSALRCFVHGQFVGMQTPAQCAEKNGVPAGALDVGLDQSGSLAAGAGDAHLAPIANTVVDNAVADVDGADSPTPPSLPTITAAPSPGLPTSLPATGPSGDCLRYVRGAWQNAGDGVALGVCVRTLFSGRCVAPGQTLYGRWASETVRLLPGRVEMSDNNRDFHPLVAQSLADCSLPPP
jgi:hypothetical protein